MADYASQDEANIAYAAGGPGLQDFASLTPDFTDLGNACTAIGANLAAGWTMATAVAQATAVADWAILAGFKLTTAFLNSRGGAIADLSPLSIATGPNGLEPSGPDNQIFAVALAYLSASTAVAARASIYSHAMGFGSIKTSAGNHTSIRIINAYGTDQTNAAVGFYGGVWGRGLADGSGDLAWKAVASDLMASTGVRVTNKGRINASKWEAQQADATDKTPHLLFLAAAGGALTTGVGALAAAQIDLQAPLT